MKIIHCSDLHLDSKMETNLSKEQARERKDEILITFKNMIQYANDNEVQIIIIAGDLFDNSRVSAKAKNIVKDAILTNKDIDFIYLKGNHDVSNLFEEDEEIPENLKLFSSTEWKEYIYGNVVITGIELTKEDNYDKYNTLMLSKNNVNIVVMHGQEVTSDSSDDPEAININKLKRKNINYLALGHIHSYKMEKLGTKGKYCYPGCLEGRGFDECGKKGFVLLDIQDDKIKTEFIEFAKRTLYEIEVDITDLDTTSDVEKKIDKEIKEIPKESLIKIVLTGKVKIGSERDIDYLLKIYNEIYYFVKIYDKTTLAINYLDYEHDASLKGEFIRLILSQENISEEEKKQIIEAGIKALSGEEV